MTSIKFTYQLHRYLHRCLRLLRHRFRYVDSTAKIEKYVVPFLNLQCLFTFRLLALSDAFKYRKDPNFKYGPVFTARRRARGYEIACRLSVRLSVRPGRLSTMIK